MSSQETRRLQGNPGLVSLKGECHEIFCFWFFFHESVYPKRLSIPLGLFRFFPKIRGDIRSSRLTTARYQRHRRQILPPVSLVLLIPVAYCHWCQQYRRQICRWQTMLLISGCRYLKVNLKAKIYIYVNSTIQRCPNKIIKIFLIEDFFHLPPVSATPLVNLELRISPRLLEKIRNGPNGILWGWGETD